MQAFVETASRIQVVNGARAIKTTFVPTSTIIDANNPLVKNSILAVQNHINGTLPLNALQLSTYLPASSVLHLLDGWNYLASAIDRLLNGDSAISIHLAYYAELRASMSFLATEGIGVFNQEHLAIDRNSNILQAPGTIGTHKFVWDCIDGWANSAYKPEGNDLLKVFSVNNFTFDEWANAFPHSSNVTKNQVIKSWLNQWNLDVNVFKNDRDSRNYASYRPQRFNNLNFQSIAANIEKLNAFWEMLEPAGVQNFELLDKYLLRLFLQKLYNTLSPPLRNNNTLESTIKTTFSRIGLNPESSLVNFLIDKQPIKHSLISESFGKALDPVTGLLNPLSVIARATLMLRLSTGSSSAIFSKAGITKSDLNFLWNQYGLENGFWINGSIPTNFFDLWDSIRDDIEDVTTWAALHSQPFSLSHMLTDSDMPKSLNFFKQFNRAGLWGFKL